MQTKAYDNFHQEWKRFIGARDFFGKKVESEIQLLVTAINILKEFVDETNSYTRALSKDESKCISDLLFAMSRLFRLRGEAEVPNTNCIEASERLSRLVCKSRKRNAPIYTGIVKPIERMCDAEPRVSPKDVETVIQDMDISGKAIDKDFIQAIGKFMSEIDAFAAENARIEVRIPPQKPFNKDTLVVFQEVLGVLHNCGDNESVREQNRIERFLRGLGVVILWPEEDIVEETAEFFVVFMPGEKTARVVKPYLKFEDIAFRGEKIMPA